MWAVLSVPQVTFNSSPLRNLEITFVNWPEPDLILFYDYYIRFVFRISFPEQIMETYGGGGGSFHVAHTSPRGVDVPFGIYDISPT